LFDRTSAYRRTCVFYLRTEENRRQDKKTPGLLVCRPGVLISSLNCPGIAPGYYALALVGFFIRAKYRARHLYMYDFLSTLFWVFLKIGENKFGGVNKNVNLCVNKK